MAEPDAEPFDADALLAAYYEGPKLSDIAHKNPFGANRVQQTLDRQLGWTTVLNDPFVGRER